MTRHRTPARSAVTRFYPNLRHPHLAALLMLVVTALVVTLGARTAAPDATAATTTGKTFETDDHVVTQAPDGTVTIIDKKTQIAVQDTIDPAATGPTEEELAAQAHGISHQFKTNLGWDLETEADRTRLLNETRALTQQLHNIPPETLNLKENATLRTVRDIVDEMDGTNNCRGRCLIPGVMRTIIVGVKVSRNLRRLKSHMAQGRPMDTAEAVDGAVLLITLSAIFWFMLEEDMNNLPEPYKWAVRVGVAFLISEVFNTLADIEDYLAHSRTTMRQAVTDAAQHLDTLNSDDELPADYDLDKEPFPT